jgi:hypothetical protein
VGEPAQPGIYADYAFHRFSISQFSFLICHWRIQLGSATGAIVFCDLVFSPQATNNLARRNTPGWQAKPKDTLKGFNKNAFYSTPSG